VETGLPHDGHVKVVDKGNFEALRPLVVVTVVEGLNVEQHCVAVVLSGFGTLQ